MPLRLHASTLLVLLTLRPYSLSIAAWLTWIVMVALHELGHGWLVRREGGRVIELIVHGLGGECSYHGVETREGHERVAWGGVLAQSLLLVAALIARAARAPVDPAILHVAVWVNLSSIAFNLLPIAPLDGARAWPLLGRWWRRWRARRAKAKQRAREREALIASNAKLLDATDHVHDTREADEVIARVTGIHTEKKDP